VSYGSLPLDKVLVLIADLDLAEGNSADAIATYEQVLICAKVRFNFKT
jgi:hypothetical protein